jgi:hypothetical protein
VKHIERVTQGYLWKIYCALRKGTYGTYRARYARKRVENIQRVRQGNVWKIHSALRKDTCGNIQRVTQAYLWKIYRALGKETRGKYTAHYARKRVENIQRVRQRNAWKIYSQLHNQTSNTTCHLLLVVQRRLFEHSQGLHTSLPTDVYVNIRVKNYNAVC